MRGRWLSIVSVGLVGLLLAGCPVTVNTDGGALIQADATKIDNSVSTIQTDDPRGLDLPSSLDTHGDTVIVESNVVFVDDPSTDLVVTELPNITLLGFENLTGFDIFVQYQVDGTFQSIYVFDGETVLLEYDCLGEIVLDFEDDLDRFDGTLVDSFDLGGVTFFNPEDFLCGDAVILTFFPFPDPVTVEIIPLD